MGVNAIPAASVMGWIAVLSAWPGCVYCARELVLPSRVNTGELGSASVNHLQRREGDA